ncbi:MAG: hypothetical protein LBK27_04330 [Treponema sp.]|nr:hypothetical protein [Treponema sp.]
MRKKGFILVFAFLTAGSLAAQMSIGAGGYLDGDFGGGSESVGNNNARQTVTLPYFGGGGFLFFDAKYVEVSFGFFPGSGKYTMEASSIPLTPDISNKTDMVYTQLSIGALGKYPFSINKALSVFPLLGFDYLITMSVKENGVEILKPEEFNALWFKLGGGVDLALSSHLYIRLDALYGLRPPTKFETNLTKVEFPGIESSLVRLGHGPTVKLALGYRF